MTSGGILIWKQTFLTTEELAMTLVPDSFTSTPTTRFKMEGLLGTLRRVMQVPLNSASCSPHSCGGHRTNLYTHQDFLVHSARLEQQDLSGRGEQAGLDLSEWQAWQATALPPGISLLDDVKYSQNFAQVRSPFSHLPCLMTASC